MESLLSIFAVSALAITFIAQFIKTRENFCNCTNMATKYSKDPVCGKLPYSTNYGWSLGMPYDSYARQMTTTPMNSNQCIPNQMAVSEMSCQPDQFQAIYKAPVKNCTTNRIASPSVLATAPRIKKRVTMDLMGLSPEPAIITNPACNKPDYGSYKHGYHAQKPMEYKNVPTYKNPECAYQNTFTAMRSPGTYGYGTKSGGYTAYGALQPGCGLPMISANTNLSCSSPAGSFTAPPPNVDECNNTNGYNLAIGVL